MIKKSWRYFNEEKYILKRKENILFFQNREKIYKDVENKMSQFSQNKI